ncbi:MAG: cob(I)yrinic acid a,c-diamide adenosyltransferase [Chitinophagaceae bacterium]|nr:MAG: cob(I)yrinic acid a,c-diamide adenosyltransferase [Chitinophagaceae bacterium]
MKIYTKTGDKGKTSLLGGTKVPKYHLRIEAYGTIDELNAHLGMIMSFDEKKLVSEKLRLIQDRLFTIGSSLAADPEKTKMVIPDLKEEDITFLENEIDKMESELPSLKNFILPGGNSLSASIHIARCVCRRAERNVVHLSEEHFTETKVIIYLNRLSDYLFVLSRWITFTYGLEEINWTPRK